MDHIWYLIVDIFLAALGRKAAKDHPQTPEQKRKSLIIAWIIGLLLLGGAIAFTVIYSY